MFTCCLNNSANMHDPIGEHTFLVILGGLTVKELAVAAILRAGCRDCGVLLMIIKKIKVQNRGYVYCKSGFYTAADGLSENSVYTFTTGINKLYGEIDSENWAVSYLLSMYTHRPEDFILFNEPKVSVNDKIMSLSELAEYSCYMDEIYPLFSTDVSVKDLVIQGIEKSKKNITYMDIKNMFDLDDQRFERPLSCVGNEVFRAMAAVGISHNKEIFCFPWLSHTRYKGYHKNLWGLMDILKSLNKIAIVPVGKKD